MAIRIQLRRDTAANWTSSNPVLRAGELGIETDTLKFKIGNGSSTWTQIANYANVTDTGLSNSLNDYILAADQGTPGGPAELDSNGDLLVPENSIILWDDADYSFTTTLSATQPTANRTITFPDATTTVVGTNTTDTLTNKTLTSPVVSGLTLSDASIVFEGAVADSYETTLTVGEPTADRTLTLPDSTDTLVGRATTDTLTNKSINLASNTLSGTLAQLNTAISDADIASLEGSETLTNKTINLASNTVLTTLAQLNTAISDADVASLAGSETLTNKTLTSPIVSGLQLSDGSIVVEGSTADNFETTVVFTDPTADRTITFQDVTGTVALLGDISAATGGSVTETGVQTLTNKTLTSPVISGLTISDGSIIVEGTTADANETTLLFTDPTADRTITFPNATGTVAFTTDVDTRLALAGGTMAGSIDMATYKITNLGTPTASADAATKAYVDNTTAGLNFHAAVHAATTANLDATYSNGTGGVGATLTANANGALVVDGHTLNANERVLVKNQTAGLENGIYAVTATGDISNPWVLTRATDADNSPSGELSYGDFTFVQQGSTNAGFGYIVNTTGTITIGTTAISYVQFNAGQVVVAGNGLTESTPGTLTINTAVTVDLNTAQTLTNKTLTSPVINTPTGISKSDVGLANVDNTSDANKPVSTATQTALDLKANLASPTFTGTVSGITATMVGLGNVDNTSDANKPVSTATQTALDLKVNTADPAVDYYITNSGSGAYLVNGVSNGTIYFEKGKKYRIHVNASGHPFWIQTVSGAYSSGNIYSTGITNNGAQNGHIIVELPSNAPQLYYACQYHSSMAGSIVTGTTFAIYKALADLSNVDNTSDANKPVSTATQTALDLKIDESLFDAKGDLLVGSSDNVPAKLTVGTNGYLLTANSSATYGVEWAAAPVSLPSQTGNGGYYLTTDGTSASWAALVVPIETGTATLTANTATTISTTALSAFTSIEYMVSLKQGSKVRTSKVVLQTDGTSVDMTEFAITETGGTMSGVVVSATTVSTDAVLQVTVTDAASTNVNVKFSKVKL